jgi:hypothetical protein
VFRWMLRISGLLTLLVVASSAFAQTEFSADMVSHGRDKNAAKIYSGKDKMRFDAKDKDPDQRKSGTVILDFSTESWTVLIPQQHMYMVMPSSTMENRGMFHFFRTGDVENACGEWLQLQDNKGGTCHKAGSETVNGRSTIKYEGTNSKGESSTVWFDSKLRFPVKWDDKNGGGELQNIQEGPQPASLFEIPAGFNKMDMGGMIKQHN